MNQIKHQTRGWLVAQLVGLAVGSLVLWTVVGISLGATPGEEKRGESAEPPATLTAAERIAELEQQVADLSKALERSQAELEATRSKVEPEEAPAPVVQPTASYDFDPGAEGFEFLNMGVQRDYVQFENGRLVDQLRTTIPPLYEPAFSPFHGYTLPAGAFRVTLSNDRFINNHDFGRDKFYSAFFNNVKVENQQLNLNVFYGIDPNNTLRITAPFRSTNISGTGEAFRIKPMVMTMEGHGFGLGDVQVMLKHKWFDQGYRRFTLATAFGVQIPSGENDNRFNDSQTLFMNGMPMPVSASAGGPRIDLFSDDLRLPNFAQPGTGSWGVNMAVMATRQLTWNGRRGALHGGVMYRAMKDTKEGVRPGNELLFGVSYVRPPFKTEHLSFDFTFFGRNKQSERFPGLVTHPEADPVTRMPLMNPDGSLKMFTTPRPPFEHGTVMFLSPSLILIPKSSLRITVSPLFRVYEPNQGPSPAVRLLIGIQTIF